MWGFMGNLVADFVKFSRAIAKIFLNCTHFQRSFKSFGILLNNSYNEFVVIIRQFRLTCAEENLR